MTKESDESNVSLSPSGSAGTRCFAYFRLHYCTSFAEALFPYCLHTTLAVRPYGPPDMKLEAIITKTELRARSI